jgi:MFS family permease
VRRQQRYRNSGTHPPLDSPLQMCNSGDDVQTGQGLSAQTFPNTTAPNLATVHVTPGLSRISIVSIFTRQRGLERPERRARYQESVLGDRTAVGSASNQHPRCDPPIRGPILLRDTLQPLKHAEFRRIWLASLFCNASVQIQGVAAAWVMLQMTSAPQQVALVQTASMLPMMLLALPGGAVADVYDRRKAAIAALWLALAGAVILSVLSLSGVLTPPLILSCCFVVGTGVAFFTPAWSASVIELVGSEALPAGVALNSMSNNLARSLGPTLGGFAIMACGATLTFGANALLYLPMLASLYAWQRISHEPKLPPENIIRASFAGLRYAAFSSSTRRVLIRGTVFSLGTSAVYALLPLVSHSTLSGDAGTYGLLLGAFGLGAVAVTLVGGNRTRKLEPEHSARLHACLQGLAIGVLAFSHFAALSALALFVVGACWIRNNATLNVSIQLSAPRWVAGRLLALFYAQMAGGLGVGSWLWGHLASSIGISQTLALAGLLLLLSPLLGLAARLPPIAASETLSVPATTSPEVGIDLDGRSGPILLQISYRIHEDDLAEFFALILQIRRSRARNGAYGVTLARDVADSQLWTEVCHYPTWHDYVRARDRPTGAERDLQIRVNELHKGPDPVRVRRLLERPYGSLRVKGEHAVRVDEAAYGRI